MHCMPVLLSSSQGNTGIWQYDKTLAVKIRVQAAVKSVAPFAAY